MHEVNESSMGRTLTPFVVNDLVIKEDNCNLACEYCLTGQSLFKEDHSLQMIFNPPHRDSCLPGTDLRARLEKVLEAVATQDVPVVKISGGEVMLIQGMMDFIGELSVRYETVVILTNGLLLSDERIQCLAQLKNIVVQLSLDATSYAGNSYRVASDKVQQALLNRLDSIVQSGLPVEIYLVLNNRSILSLEETLDYLTRYDRFDLSVYPFPVRGPDRERFFPKREQYEHLLRVIKRAEQYGNLLPERAYLERLWRFFDEGTRGFGCHLPRIAFTSFDDGLVTSCPNIWFNHVGSLISESSAEVFERLGNAPFRQLLLSPRPRVDACKACFTPWDPVSLYFEGVLTMEQLQRIPIYRGARTQLRLAQIRDAYIRGISKEHA